jgi:hypothetical protein
MTNPRSRTKTTKVKAPHHRGDHQVRARRVVDTAKRDPSTLCWRCHRTLAAHPRHKTGRPAFWTAGHTGRTPRELAPEASTCNFDHGAHLGAQRLKAKVQVRGHKIQRTTDQDPPLRSFPSPGVVLSRDAAGDPPPPEGW